MPALRQPLGPGSAASRTLLAIRFTTFAGGGREFRSSLLDRCTLHVDPRNLVFIFF